MATEKQYSFVSATRVGDSVGKVLGQDVFGANVTLQGFIGNDPEVREMKDGRKVMNISIALNNIGKKINGAIGIKEKAGETTWIRASIFDSEHVPAATRAEKVLKKGMLVALNGYVKPEEYNNQLQLNMTVDQFKISWSKEKGKTVGGDYSFVSARKANKEGTAIVAFEGFIGKDPEVRVTPSGKEVLSFSVALNKVGNKLDYALGLKGDKKDVTWITVNVWDNDGYPLKSRAEKALKKGMAILGHGLMTANESNGSTFYNMNLNDFEIVRGLGEKKEMFDAKKEIQVDDEPADDLPF